MNEASPSSFLPRDFIEADPGLLFAVVAHGLEFNRVPCFLRYVREKDMLRKMGTEEALEWLESRHPGLMFQSMRRGVLLQGVSAHEVVAHFRPQQRLIEILRSGGSDLLEQKVARVARLLGAKVQQEPWLGVTGSVLVGAQREGSDIDLVYYDRAMFQQGRQRMRAMIESGEVQSLDDAMWRETYRRRGGSLTFDQYVWHERRKWNKFLVEGTKVDISWVSPTVPQAEQPVRKLMLRVIQATVTDDRDAFDYPSCYGIGHPEISEIVSYNPTYTGQALSGEVVEASGWVERYDNGRRRLLVGTSRESLGEYIRVL